MIATNKLTSWLFDIASLLMYNQRQDEYGNMWIYKD